MLSGNYTTRELSESGNQSYPSATYTAVSESLEHILIHCPAYTHIRNNVTHKSSKTADPIVSKLVANALNSSYHNLMQFLLDATVLPDVRLAVLTHGQSLLGPLLNITRTWCYSIHRERMQLLGLWRFS